MNKYSNLLNSSILFLFLEAFANFLANRIVIVYNALVLFFRAPFTEEACMLRILIKYLSYLYAITFGGLSPLSKLGAVYVLATPILLYTSVYIAALLYALMGAVSQYTILLGLGFLFYFFCILSSIL